MTSISAESAPSHFAPEQTKDPIRIELMIGIFTVVAVILWYLMWPTWQVEWHTYQKTSQMQKGNFSGAINHLQWLLNSHTPAKGDEQDSMKNPTLLSETAFCYGMAKDWENAEKYYRLAQENNRNLSPDDQGVSREPTDFTTDIGAAQLQRGNEKGAEETLLAALKKNKLDTKANFVLGELEMKKGNYAKATQYFKVVARHPWYEPQVKKYYSEIEKKMFANVQ